MYTLHKGKECILLHEGKECILLHEGKECIYTTLCRKGMYVYYSMKKRNVFILLYN